MNSKKPYFSIIIPTYERPVELNRCLLSITKLDYPKDKYEVIVVDDGSRLQPDKIIDSYSRRLNIRLYCQSNSGPAKARNTGAKQAEGEFLAFTDDDCEPEKNWLEAFEAEFRKNPDRMLGGRTINSLKDNPYSTASHELIEYIYSYYSKDPNEARFFTSNNMAISTRLFRDIGCFDITTLRATAEDREICDRLRFLGYNMAYVPQAIVFHSHHLSLHKFWKQHFNYGRGAYYFRKARAIRGQNAIEIEPISFYINLLRYPMLKNTKHHYTHISSLLVLSQLANTVGFFWEYAIRKINKA